MPALIGLLLPLRVLATPTVELRVDPPVVGVGETATVTVTVTEANGGSFRPPLFGELHVTGPDISQQSFVSLGNGAPSFRSSTVRTWTVDAPREGVFKIGSASLVYHGDTFTSEPAELKCSANAPARPSRQRAWPFAGAQLGGTVDPFAGLDDTVRRRHSNKDVFLKVVLDKPEVYLGEQVTLSLYLFSDVDLAGVSSVTFPKLDGFWAEDIEIPMRPTPEVRTLDGTDYNVFLLRRRALFPLQSGELAVDAVEAEVAVSHFFTSLQAETVKPRSLPMKLTVKPLPGEGQPLAFESANVGSLKITATAAPLQTVVGQPVELKQLVEGIGNIKSLHPPKLSVPEGLKTFEPTVTDKIRINGGRYGGSKETAWVLIPERTGDFQLPPFEYPYFDPVTQAYAVARTEPITLHVAAGAAPAVSSSGQPGPSVTPSVIASGLRPIRLRGDLSATAIPLWQRGLFWPIALLPVLLFGFAWGGTSVIAAWRRRDPELLRVKRAHSAASRRLKAARDRLDANDSKEFYAEVIRALQQFVTDKAGVGALGLTHTQLEQALTGRGFVERDVRAFVGLLEICETARFSPTASAPSSMIGVLSQAQAVLDGLESSRLGTRAA
jgi:hypothetical protein